MKQWFAKFSIWLKKWRASDYLRQFSVVAAGVFVTFVGSDAISSCSSRKEIRSTMHLIVRELQNNQMVLSEIMFKYEHDRKMARYSIDNGFDVSRFHTDTLIKYLSFASKLSRFSYSSDALEVLKSSSLMQKIDDKNLLLSITEVYKIFDNAEKLIADYYDIKKSVILPTLLSLDVNTGVNTTPERIFGVMYSNIEFCNFCLIADGFIDIDYWSGKYLRIERLIDELERRYQ